MRHTARCILFTVSIILLSLPGQIDAFKFIQQNTSLGERQLEETVVIYCYWLDHPYKIWGPAAVFVSEIEPGKSNPGQTEHNGKMWQFKVTPKNSNENWVMTKTIVLDDIEEIELVFVIWNGARIEVDEVRKQKQ